MARVRSSPALEKSAESRESRLRAKPNDKYNTGDGKKVAKLSDNEMLEIHEKRLRRILDVAVCGGNDTVILILRL